MERLRRLPRGAWVWCQQSGGITVSWGTRQQRKKSLKRHPKRARLWSAVTRKVQLFTPDLDCDPTSSPLSDIQSFVRAGAICHPETWTISEIFSITYPERIQGVKKKLRATVDLSLKGFIYIGYLRQEWKQSRAVAPLKTPLSKGV